MVTVNVLTADAAAPEAPAFSYRSERPCLDFAATLMFRSPGAVPRELLDSPARLTAWTRGAGLVTEKVRCSAAELAAAVELREAIYRAGVARVEGRAAAAADRRLLNTLAATPPPTVNLGTHGTLTRRGPIAAVLSSLARDAIELLGGPDAARLRQCGRDGCTRMFVDRSRGGNRSWCGMRECGNRVNAAAYRRRRSGSPTPTTPA
jgi:predicted RNA-binding Zn ribbon-like protein